MATTVNYDLELQKCGVTVFNSNMEKIDAALQALEGSGGGGGTPGNYEPAGAVENHNASTDAHSSLFSGKVDKAGDTISGPVIIGAQGDGIVPGEYSFAQGEENAVVSKIGSASGFGNIVCSGGTVFEAAQAEANTIVLKTDAPVDLAGKQVLISCFGLLEGALAKTVVSVSGKTLTFAEGEDFENVQAVVVPGSEIDTPAPLLPAGAQGSKNIVSGDCSFAQGSFCIATGNAAQAEGASTIASGVSAHAEGTGTMASGNYSHAEGMLTTASGDYSHAEGYATEATAPYSMIVGKHGTTNADTLFAVANGNSAADANLAFEVTASAEVKVNDQLVVNAQGRIAADRLPIRFVEFVLGTDGWTGSAAPYTQTVEVDGVVPGMHGWLTTPQTATSQQRAAAREALLSITGLENGRIIVVADGEKPTLDLTVCAFLLGE